MRKLQGKKWKINRKYAETAEIQKRIIFLDEKKAKQKWTEKKYGKYGKHGKYGKYGKMQENKYGSHDLPPVVCCDAVRFVCVCVCARVSCVVCCVLHLVLCVLCMLCVVCVMFAVGCASCVLPVVGCAVMRVCCVVCV